MITILLIPIITATLCYSLKNHKIIKYTNFIGAVSLALFSAPVIISSISSHQEMMNGMLYMDALSGYIMAVAIFIFLAAAIYSMDYMGHELDKGVISIRNLRHYYALMHLFVFTMLLTCVSNNLALFWIAIEATTLVSALLVGFYKDKQSIEAAWKYIILCTVSITFALLGIFVTYYASVAVIGGNGTLNWTELRDIASKLNPSTMRLAFIFILVGYGAKAGLAPIHNWLPDAHSQAPTPVSALLSSVLLKCAFIGVVRFIPLTDTNDSCRLLTIFGLLSMGIATAFILLQNDYKRLLAYHSIEHIGIISTGMGIGGFWGIYGALLHTFNHAVVKALLFFTTGQVRVRYNSTEIAKVKGAISIMPVAGTIMLLSALAIAGAPPFNIFLSEFTIMKAAFDDGKWITFIFFILFATIIFGGVLHHFGGMSYGKPDINVSAVQKEGIMISTILILLAAVMLLLGLYIPNFLNEAIKESVYVIQGK